MASRSHFTYSCVLRTRLQCLSLDFKRDIKTEGNQKKGKLGVIKKKYLQDEKSVEIMEVKSTSSAMKKLNWENNQLFGGLVSAAKQCCSKTRDMVKPKRSPSTAVSSQIKRTPVMVEDNCAIPIRNVTLNSNSSLGEAYNNEVLSYILEFPLTNIMSKKLNNSLYVDKLNYLRQHLSSLCGTDNFPSVTTILEKTMPPERVMALEKWKSDMIKKMGYDEFKLYQENLLASGSLFHNCVSMYLSGVPESELAIDESNVGYWSSLKSFLPEVKDIRFLEEHIAHQFLCYRGVADCFGRYKNNFVVIDWKTSKKLKPTLQSTFDSPLQVAAYAGAMNFDRNWSYLVNSGIIAIAYNNGRTASIHYMDEKTLQHYWKLWLMRLKSYWENISDLEQSDCLKQNSVN